MKYKVINLAFSIIFIFALVFSSVGVSPAFAASLPLVEGKTDNGSGTPAELSEAEWAQIKSLLPKPVAAATQEAYLKASNAGGGDNFGAGIAVDGDTVVVSASSEDSDGSSESNNSALDAGAVYVFTRSGSTWSQQAYLKASNAEAYDYFGLGTAVAIDGDTIVVGARYEDSDGSSESDNSASAAGAAYVFTRSGTTWSQQAYLKASNAEGDDMFGQSVAVDGDTIVVGAWLEDSSAAGGESDNSAGSAGAAYVFTRSGTTWSQQAYLKASNAGGGDTFGQSVAVDGDTVVVGAWWEDSSAAGGESDNSAGQAGAAYVFTRSGTTWSQQAYLKASNAEGGDNFGHSVAVDGDTVVVGARAEDSSASGGESDNSASSAGAAYVFTRSGSTWSQQAYMKASNAEGSDFFGGSVAVYGDTVVVGGELEDSSASGGESDNSASTAGAAYVFTRSGTTWTQQDYLKASNAGAGDYFGHSVGVDGDTVVVGAVWEDSSASGGESDNSAGQAGAAYVFDSDTTFPSVSSSVPADGAILTAGINELTVTFSEDVKNDGSTGAANNTANYLLVEAGLNGTFDTATCAASVATDDTEITITSAIYTSTGFVVTLDVGTELPAGSYRLYVCGTTSIEDLAGNELNNGLSDAQINFTIQASSSSGGNGSGSASALPATGFRHGQVTSLPEQPAAKAYTDTAMTLEIPKLGVSMPIVGVPQTGSEWDVTWLGNSAGYLAGSAFPTWAGNTVITGHVWDAYNRPGAFAEIKSLKYGDQVQIQAWGATYTYEVRESKLVTSKNTSKVFQSEEYDWVTLMTCEYYNPFKDNYLFRRMVRAVLVSVK